MDDSRFVHVPRQADGPDRPPRSAPTLQWRKIALLLTPVVLAVGNLISAHFERQVAFARAANIYATFDGRGQTVKAGAIEAATNRGDARIAALIGEARNKARTELSLGKISYATSVQQGKEESAIAQSIAHSYLPKLFAHTPEFVSLIHEIAELEYGAHHNRYLTVDRETGQFTVHERQPDGPAQDRMHARLWKLSLAKRKELEEVKAQAISEGARTFADIIGIPYCDQQ